MNIFDLSGPEFLEAYFAAFCGGIVLAFVLPHLLRFPFDLPMRCGKELGAFEIAYLGGGRRKAYQSAIVSLWQRRMIATNSKGGTLRCMPAMATARPVPHAIEPLEEFVLSQVKGEIVVKRLYEREIPEAVMSREMLYSERVLLSRFRRGCLRLLRVLPLLAVLTMGVIKIGVGISRERPVGYLLAWSLVTLGLAIAALFRVPMRTWRGDRLLWSLQLRNSALRYLGRRKMVDFDYRDVAWCVAIFGVQTAALGSAMNLTLEPPNQSKWFNYTHTDSSGGAGGWGGGGGCGGAGGGGCGGGGCGGGGGGGGCGGGGCGGCGGGGH